MLAQIPDGSAIIDRARRTVFVEHENVVKVIDVELVDQVLMSVAEYVEGASLGEVVHELRPRFALAIVIDALRGLHVLHGLGVVHGRISARAIRVGSDGVGRIVPTPVAPGLPSMDVSGDVFAMGVVLWNALTGRELDLGGAAIPRPSSIGAQPPTILDAVVMRALDRDAAKRYASAAELADALHDVASKTACLATPDETAAWIGSLFEAELAELRALALPPRENEMTTHHGPDDPNATSELDVDADADVEIEALAAPPPRPSHLAIPLPLPAPSTPVPSRRPGTVTASAIFAAGSSASGVRKRPTTVSSMQAVQYATPEPLSMPMMPPMQPMPAAWSRRQVALVALAAFTVVFATLGWRYSKAKSASASTLDQAPAVSAAVAPPASKLEVTLLDVRTIPRAARTVAPPPVAPPPVVATPVVAAPEPVTVAVPAPAPARPTYNRRRVVAAPARPVRPAPSPEPPKQVKQETPAPAPVEAAPPPPPAPAKPSETLEQNPYIYAPTNSKKKPAMPLEPNVYAK